YEVIDVDPHFKRVVKYMRPTDYLAWAGLTAAAPAGLLLMEHIEPVFPSGQTRIVQMRPVLRASVVIGLVGGFLFAYTSSSQRFWGYSENATEVEKDRYEMKSKIAQGKPLYGETKLEPWLEQVAVRNSRFSQTLFTLFPWFNFANHKYHGIDIKKYFETRPGEESWGFNLPSYDE
ncbi:hypothetical protein CANCADRAFT_17689, partial [Tortispora caseinolytica NRRL Y-17796]